MIIETIFGKEKDLFFMSKALKLAAIAASLNEIPVGAVVVNPKGEIIGQGYNNVELNHSQTAHAESLAINQAGKALQSWHLLGCWIYVTLEPCAMCIELIKLSRLSGVVFGSNSPIFGFQLDKPASFWVYKRDAFSIIEGVMADEASILLKKFFQEKRNCRERKT